jgi:uncharacterized protein YndB with AHSA1/START domain
MVEIHVERTIAAPPENVFDWLADPVNLAAAPMALKGFWEKGTVGPGKGAVRRVIAAGPWFREEITAYDRPRSYRYLIIGGFPPFRHDGGTLTFTPTGGDNPGTHLDWLTNYTHPAYVGGKVLEKVTRPMLRSSFVAILDACARALEK